MQFWACLGFARHALRCLQLFVVGLVAVCSQGVSRLHLACDVLRGTIFDVLHPCTCLCFFALLDLALNTKLSSSCVCSAHSALHLTICNLENAECFALRYPAEQLHTDSGYRQALGRQGPAAQRWQVYCQSRGQSSEAPAETFGPVGCEEQRSIECNVTQHTICK